MNSFERRSFERCSGWSFRVFWANPVCFWPSSTFEGRALTGKGFRIRLLGIRALGVSSIVFERYTERARRVIFVGRYEAQQYGSPCIEPEHLLLGLLREDKRLWKRLLDSPAALTASIRELLDRTARPRLKTETEIPLSVVSKLSIRAVEYEAEIASSDVIDTEHILLSLLNKIGERPVSAVLEQYRISYENVRFKLFDARSYLQTALKRKTNRVNLSHLNLKALPTEILNLTELQSLDLSYNQLESIPESISELQYLEKLDISFNRLINLPTTLLRLESLKSLDVRGNSHLDLPPELLANGADAQTILSYYFRTARESSPLNEAKLVLVGRGGVGKTSLVRRLVRGDFNPREKETPGINITQWNLRLRGNDTVRLHVWDFGGQEIMHATHQFFLTERSLYVLVLGGRENTAERDAEYWLKMIESFGGRSPVIVVLNKIAESPF
jgi:hypothetical protein